MDYKYFVEFKSTAKTYTYYYGNDRSFTDIKKPEVNVWKFL